MFREYLLLSKIFPHAIATILGRHQNGGAEKQIGLLSSDGFVLRDVNGLILIPKEAE